MSQLVSESKIKSIILESLRVDPELRTVLGDEEGLAQSQVIDPLFLLLDFLEHSLLVLLNLVEGVESRTDVSLFLRCVSTLVFYFFFELTLSTISL